MKLRWFLKRWRQGKVLPHEEDDFLEVRLSSAPPLGGNKEAWGVGSASPTEQRQGRGWVTVKMWEVILRPLFFCMAVPSPFRRDCLLASFPILGGLSPSNVVSQTR